VLRGLKKTRWPARFQIVSARPLTIIDGAHNPAGIRVLAEALKKTFPGKRFTFVFGAQQDKDSATMVELLKPLANRIIITHSSHRHAAEKSSLPLAAALRGSVGDDRVIAGSLFLAADALKLLDRGNRA
jgi:dihydrofolate synthase/folylpolyglutamate synthase